MEIIDIHCHPATKVNFGHDIEEQHFPLMGKFRTNDIDSRRTYKSWI
jgi:hypothetical protein